MIKYVNEKIASNKATIRALQLENEALEIQKTENAGKKGIEKWRGNIFESSSALTKEFSDFAREFKRELRKALDPVYVIEEWSRGHFEVSGFVKNEKTGKFAYVSISDVRHFLDGWYENILVRTAEHAKDYTGGSNGSATWPGLPKAIAGLTA